MDNTTKTVIIVIVAVLAGAWLYHVYSSTQTYVQYDYTLYSYDYYQDDEGEYHYPESGNRYLYAYVTEIAVGTGSALATPNCYSFIDTDYNRYELTAGHTDMFMLDGGEITHLLVIFEVPKSVTKGAVVWNVDYIPGERVYQ